MAAIAAVGLVEWLDAVLVEEPADFEHGVGAAEDDHVVVFGEFNHVVGDFFVADYDDDVERSHVAGAYSLDVAEAGDEHRGVFEGQNVAHKVGGEGGFNLFVEAFATSAYFGIQKINNFAECHVYTCFSS